ncbi:retropepsin-like aspartic protease [Niabella beijingensis]|uniref:retropepsin-like aspartic protease n=1 Tax=Niabella beijingensis TaxID=2872700 RepID=UPI001CC10E3F|nr:retropepsin-like aspartic protease [Niabella beijingensis]MBZ4188934.1 retropepsin-like domain-containing protein [Niabella beijingensis]
MIAYLFKRCVASCILFCYLLGSAQTVLPKYIQAEQNLEQLYHKRDLFKLRSQFNRVKSGLPDDKKLFYQAVIDNVFNRCETSNEMIEQFNKRFPAATDSVRRALLLLQADNYSKLYQYQQAANCYDSLIHSYPALKDSAIREDLEGSKALWTAIASVPAQQISINYPAIVPFQKDKIGLIEVPMTREQDTCNLIFDTGANISVITESNARKMHMEIYPVNIDVASGISGQVIQSSLAVSDTLFLGKILITNAVFLLLPDDMLYFKQQDYQQQGIIGQPIISQLEQIIIRQSGTIEIMNDPVKNKEYNLAFDGPMPIVNFTVGQDRLPFRFDTGTSSSVLYQPFFTRYKNMIVKEGTPYELKSAGVGGMVSTAAAYKLKNFRIDVAGHKVMLPEINVRTTPLGESENYYGNLGIDLLQGFKSFTINFKEMFIEVE